MQNAGYLFAAYTAVWVVFFGYVLTLLNRQKGLRRDIDTLKQALKKNQEGSQR